MKFEAEPGLYVIDSVTGRQIGRFDEKGYMNINDEKTAQRMEKRFAKVNEKQRMTAPKGKGVK